MFDKAVIAWAFIDSLIVLLLVAGYCYSSRLKECKAHAKEERNLVMNKEIVFTKQHVTQCIKLSEVACYTYAIEEPNGIKKLFDYPTLRCEVNWDAPRLYKKVTQLCGHKYDSQGMFKDIVDQHP